MAVKTRLNLTDSSTLAALSEPAIAHYFETLNLGDFEATGRLFASEGVLHAPFEDPIVGPSAISAYLAAEAKGMQLIPQQGVTQALANGNLQVQLNGRVNTPVFGVNVGWIFVLNQQGEIMSATIKLLASPQELMNLRSATKF